jgi:hypothetical protein
VVGRQPRLARHNNFPEGGYLGSSMIVTANWDSNNDDRKIVYFARLTQGIEQKRELNKSVSGCFLNHGDSSKP